MQILVLLKNWIIDVIPNCALGKVRYKIKVVNPIVENILFIFFQLWFSLFVAIDIYMIQPQV